MFSGVVPAYTPYLRMRGRSNDHQILTISEMIIFKGRFRCRRCCLSSLLSLSMSVYNLSKLVRRTRARVQMDGLISAANWESFVSQLALLWKDDQFGNKQHSQFDRMGHLQLSDHLVRNRQTGEQMRHLDMLNKGKLACPRASFTLQFGDLYQWLLSCNRPIDVFHLWPGWSNW